MNWRAIGCLVVGSAVFVGIGLLGMSLAFSEQPGCPATLQWADRGYLPDGSPQASPDLGGGHPGEIGSTFIGLTTRHVYGPPGSTPSERAEDRPDRIVLDCGDGTYQVYEWSSTSTAVPSS